MTALAQGTPIADPDAERALDLAMQLMAIPGSSGKEGRVSQFIQDQLQRAGIARSALQTDSANQRAPIRGQTGNLILRLPGTCRGPRRMFSAHMDTVPICAGSRPVRDGDLVRSAGPNSGLGADDRSGVAVILNTVLEIAERGLPHPPLTFCWFIQEETGLHGSRCVSKRMLGKPQMAFNWDGGSAAKLTIGATGGYRMTIEVRGIASHAGGAPEYGISAIVIAALAIAQLHRDRWHGDIRKGRSRGTSNVGVIRGGDATNVVTDRVLVRAEARSHSPAMRRRIQRKIETAFKKAAREVKNTRGETGAVTFEGSLDYESFQMKKTEPCVQRAVAAVESIGRQPVLAVANGGIDANWLVKHGIPTVSLGCGAVDPHTVDEALNVLEFKDACRMALHLATDCAG